MPWCGARCLQPLTTWNKTSERSTFMSDPLLLKLFKLKLILTKHPKDTFMFDYVFTSFVEFCGG